MNLYIRADADYKSGTGHIMRCIALGQAWQDRGGNVTFLSHCESEALRERISKEGFQFIAVNAPHPHPDDLSITLEYLKRPLPFTLHPSHTWLVLDGYHFDSEYQQAIRAAGVRLLVIDDMNHLPHYHADILLNQNIHAPDLKYRCDADTTLLLGTRYVLLRREFLKYRDFKRQIPDKAKDILVTLGGADPDNVTLKVIEALKLLGDVESSVKIIIGPANPHRTILSEALSSTNFSSQLLTNPPNIPDLMAWADLAVSAGGSTCWELAFMGVPTIVLVLAENQHCFAEGLEQAGMAINLGWFNQVSDGQISDRLMRLINDSEKCTLMSRSGQQLVDGNGCSRVMQVMFDRSNEDYGGRLRIRLATMLDAVALWQLANDPNMRMNAFNPDPILFDHHVEWLKGKLTSHDTRIWLLELDGSIVAQVRYDRVDLDTAEIDFTVVPALRGKGLGTKTLTLTCHAACVELGVKHLVGLAFDSNLSSARAFMKAGFKLINKGEQVRGHSCSIFECHCEGAQ